MPDVATTVMKLLRQAGLTLTPALSLTEGEGGNETLAPGGGEGRVRGRAGRGDDRHE